MVVNGNQGNEKTCHAKRVLWNILFVRNICRHQSTSREPLYLSLLLSVYSKGANISVQAMTKLNSPSDIWSKKISQRQQDFPNKLHKLLNLDPIIFTLCNDTYRMKNWGLNQTNANYSAKMFSEKSLKSKDSPKQLFWKPKR